MYIKMTTIRVISKKISYCDIKSLNRFALYSNTLNRNVRSKSGFVKSESYWEYNSGNQNVMKENIIYTISEWDSITDWTNWLGSSERMAIKINHQDILASETFRILIKNREREDIFLL